MGGFGAINIALKHHDIFCGVYAFAPGLFDENGLRNAFASWASMPGVKRAYGAEFA
jgi:S-formylglutathione hydrolase FrmB